MLDSFAKKFGLKPNNTIQIKEVEKNSIKVEIKEYKINLEKNILTFSSFWKTYSTQFPLLASQVRKYCIVPFSSVAVESSFSDANFLQRKERSSLSSKNLRYSSVLKSTYKSTIIEDLNQF
jgi:hypothetical protein